MPTGKPRNPKTCLNPPSRGSPEPEGGAGAPADGFSPSPQEALHRELLLKQKMVILQELFSTLLQASEKSWQVPEHRAGRFLLGLRGGALPRRERVQKQEPPWVSPFLGAEPRLCLASVLYRRGVVAGLKGAAVT